MCGSGLAYPVWTDYIQKAHGVGPVEDLASSEVVRLGGVGKALDHL